MPEMLQLLVIHPHDDLMPGDIIDLTEEQYEERTRSHPFPYFTILEGALLRSVAGNRLPAAPSTAELPLEVTTVPSAIAAEFALEKLEDLTAQLGPLHAESYEPETAPPFAEEVQDQVVDDSTPVTEPISGVLEDPALGVVALVDAGVGTAATETALTPEQLLTKPPEEPVVPETTVAVEPANGSPPKAKKAAKK